MTPLHKVLIVQRRLPHYRVSFFERLRTQLAEESIRLSVTYGSPAPWERRRADQGELTWGIPQQAHYVGFSQSHCIWFGLPTELISQQDLVILPHESALLDTHFLLSRLNRSHAKLALWGHGRNFQHRSYIRDYVKRRMLRKVAHYFAYTELSAQVVIDQGMTADHVTVIQNSIDTNQMAAWRVSVTAEEQRRKLQELGLRGTQVGVFLGSLTREKRIPQLLDASLRLRKRFPDFELIVIGDGPIRRPVQEFAERHPWMCWLGVAFGREKAVLVSLGHVLLNPGMVGLNLLDGFSLGLPMVTTDCGIHSPEIDYLDHGRNGLMTPNSLEAFVEGAASLFAHPTKRQALVAACLLDAGSYTIENMVQRFASGISGLMGTAVPMPTVQLRKGLPPSHIGVIWQRFLPYHIARLGRLSQFCRDHGIRLTAIEVAAQDDTYGFPDSDMEFNFEWVRCLNDISYNQVSATEVHQRVLSVLLELGPQVVFAPATPFPEGMAAITYRNRTSARVVVMDDAVEFAVNRNPFKETVKRLVHQNVDGVLIPAPSHKRYFLKLGFPAERVAYGLDVVDNDFFRIKAEGARAQDGTLRETLRLPLHFFLFVGRLLQRKGLSTLLLAFLDYQATLGAAAWDLVLVGKGHFKAFDMYGTKGIHLLGPRYGDELAQIYGLAKALIVPSLKDPWGLVINEGMAAGLPILASRGCGATSTLVEEGLNGWAFPPGDRRQLAALMGRMSSLNEDSLESFGRASQEIIRHWSLDRFAQGVAAAIGFPRREQAGALSNLVSAVWKGKIAVR